MLTGIVEEIIDKIIADGEGWLTVAEVARQVFKGLRAAKIPLDVLGAVVEYARSRNRQVLLRLPPEQRSLVGKLIPENAAN